MAALLGAPQLVDGQGVARRGRLDAPGGDGAGEDRGADQQGAGQAVVGSAVFQQGDADLQRMGAAGRPVAAEGQGLGGELGLQQGAGIEAAVARAAGRSRR